MAFVLMTVLVILARIVKGSSSSAIIALPATIFFWFAVLMITTVQSLFLTTVFFGVPLDLRSRLVETTQGNPFNNGLPPPSARYSIRLCESAGKTLGELSDNLLAALNRAGYTDHAIYPFQDGFAVLTRFEQRDSAGYPSRDRWPEWGEAPLPLSKLFTVDYIRALFLGKSGIFRFFIFTLTPESPTISSQQTTPTQARKWLLTGPSQLPNKVRDFQTKYPFLFTSAVYEFDATGDHAEFVPQSKLTGLTELLGSKIVARPKNELTASSICFDSRFATLQ
jgi:hypothetical protein